MPFFSYGLKSQFFFKTCLGTSIAYSLIFRFVQHCPPLSVAAFGAAGGRVDGRTISHGEKPMPYPRKRVWIVGGIILTACVVLAGAGVAYTSGTDFCLSCHEMRVYREELKLSSHARDADGKEIACSQCHIPSGNVLRMASAKAWLGLKDLWVHHVDGGEDLNRAAMQPVARRFTDDANCLACHRDLTRNAKNDGPISQEGKLAHENYEGRNGQARSNCVGCHRNLAHLPVFDERIPVNRKFAQKLKESRS